VVETVEAATESFQHISLEVPLHTHMCIIDETTGRMANLLGQCWQTVCLEDVIRFTKLTEQFSKLDKNTRHDLISDHSL